MALMIFVVRLIVGAIFVGAALGILMICTLTWAAIFPNGRVATWIDRRVLTKGDGKW